MSNVALAAEEDGHDPLTTKEGWRAFVDRDASMPELLPSDRWKRLGELDRERYDQARLKHHAQLVVVATPTIRQVAHLVRRLVLLNRGQVGARRGLVVTGSPATGKTTAITQVGKRHELHVRDQQTDSRERLPVVYVTVPPAATPRIWAWSRRFLTCLTSALVPVRSPVRASTAAAAWSRLPVTSSAR